MEMEKTSSTRFKSVKGLKRKRGMKRMNKKIMSIALVVIICITIAAPAMAQPSPFVIIGHVSDSDGSPCNGAWIQITNLNTSVSWDAENSSTSNYYKLVLDSDNVSVGNILRFEASGCTETKTVEHTVTQSELDDGGMIGFDIVFDAELMPDLTITKIALKTAGYATEDNLLGVTVKNIGSANAGSFDVSLEVDGLLLGAQTFSSLGAGASTELGFAWTPAEPGSHILSATADVNSEVEESDETNNDLTRTSVIITRSDWPQFHYDEAHVGFSPSKAPNTNNTLWISDDMGAVAGSSTVVAEGKVFVYGSSTGGTEGETQLYCFNELTGVVIWNVSISAPVWGSWSSPAYHDGKVFTSIETETGCYNAATGEQIWAFENPTGEASINGGPVIADGKVVCNDWQGGHYYCLDEETGELLWTFTEEQKGQWGVGYTQGVPAYEDGKFYITTWIYIGGNVYCIDADTGAEMWHQTTPLDTCGSPAVVDGIVYVTNYNFYGDGEIYAMDATNGTILWSHTIQRTDSTPAVAYGNVYVCGGCKGFSPIQTYCFNATTGDVIWSTDAADRIGGWTCSVAVADNKVFVGKPSELFDYAGIYALDADSGSEVWHYDHSGASPAVANGRVFTIGEGKVYCFGESSPLAPVALFTHFPVNPEVNQTITFDAFSSYDNYGTITEYNWDFGDGMSGSGEIITHSYSLAGDYMVTLTVVNDLGLTNSVSKLITVFLEGLFMEVVDQEQLENPSRYNTAVFGPCGQEFTPTLDNLARVEFHGSIYPATEVCLNIRESTIDGPILWTETRNLPATPEGLATWISFDIPQISLRPGSLYVIETRGASLSWGHSKVDVYPGGQGIYEGNPVDWDWAFRTWGVTQAALDLTPTAITAPDDIYDGIAANITTTISNIGTCSATSFDVDLYAGHGRPVDTQNVASLAPGESTDVTFSWTPASTGDLTLKVVADSGRAIAESDETNNELTKTVTVLDRYTLNVPIDPAGSGTVELNLPGGFYAPETNVTLTANPAEGCTFDHWSGDLSGSINPETIIMDGNKIVTAHFAVGPDWKIPAGVTFDLMKLDLNSSGIIKAFITLPEGYDVADIDVSTVECEGAYAFGGGSVIPGKQALEVKFKIPDLVGVPTGDAVSLSVTGELTTGERFEGSNTLKVIAK